MPDPSEERIAHRTDRPDAFEKGKTDRCRRELEAREVDAGEKSFWSFTKADGRPLTELIGGDPRQACQALHALLFLLMIFRNSNGKVARTNINLVSVATSAVAGVRKEPNAHAINGFDHTHRLARAEGADADALVRIFLNGAEFGQYDKTSLLELLRILVDADEVSNDYRDAAQELLAASKN